MVDRPLNTRAVANAPKRVLLLGATGTIGQATRQALLARGHAVLSVVRRASTGAPGARPDAAADASLGVATELCVGDLSQAQALATALSTLPAAAARFDVLVSCMASRSGVPHDAWAVEHRAQSHALQAARAAGVQQVVLLSALCVQKPRLAFQHAKLAFERELIDSGLTHSIVRPTAFFKSLSGQVAGVQQGKPFWLFGDGRLTACKPIADADLAEYLVDCIADASRHDRVLPIGGPGPAITPREQGDKLFELLGRKPRYRSAPAGLLAGVGAVLGNAGRVWPAWAAKAELARIGHYYATESMLVWDAAQQRYDAAATPSTGRQTLFDFYAQLLRGEASVDRREHAVF